jgi:prepilin peptidase CpaA
MPATGVTITTLGLLVGPLLGVAAWSDLRQRRIPNRIVAAIALLWLPVAASGEPLAALAALITAALVLSVGISVWNLGCLGGGDVKLAAVLSLWAGPSHLGGLLLAVALSGGGLSLLILAARHAAVSRLLSCLGDRARWPLASVPIDGHRAPLSRAPAGAAGHGTIPYGVALAIGGAWLLHRLFLA